MPNVILDDYQIDAVNRMKNGCILCGDVGSGKSRTALAYYEKDFREHGSSMPLYIITTAKKRDTKEWPEECEPFGMPFIGDIVVDSWNNIEKYVGVSDAFFIFDEQRVVGSGAWVKCFLKIVKKNRWILLSATPGDTWKDYIPVFIANGFYKNRTQFVHEHIVYSQFTNFPKIDRYLEQDKLKRYRNQILVKMDYKKRTESKHEDVMVEYDILKYKSLARDMWNPWKCEPIDTAGELCYAQRKVCNSDPSRIEALEKILKKHPKAIIFYNFDYELEILRNFCEKRGIMYAEWNGHKHEDVRTLSGDSWIYLSQYSAGAEGWNCITTDTTIFYSQNYSYKTLKQATGRIDRRNTPYDILYYFHLRSFAGIDVAIKRALKEKKQFNEQDYVSSRYSSRKFHAV